MLARARWLPEVRDNEARGSDAVRSATSRGERRARRQDAADRRLRQIGGRLAWLAMAFDMRVIGIRRDPRAGAGHADAVHAMSDLKALLPQADFVALTCPLTAETEKLIDADRARATADQGRRARRHGRGAAARGLAAVDDGERAYHATYRRRDLPLRGQCARDHAGESRAALAGRDRAAEPGGLDHPFLRATVNFTPKGG